MGRLGLRARGAMARDCLFGRDYRHRLRHFRVVGFSANAAFWSRGPRWLHHRHCGKSIRIAAVGWRALEKAREEAATMPSLKTEAGCVLSI
jgi:hypothetical protein